MQIPTYVINLKARTDRKEHIINEFAGRDEFAISIIEAYEHKTGAIGLWSSIKQIIQKAYNEEEEYVLVCEDDHMFTEAYSSEILFNNIAEAKERDAHILSGGVSWFQDALQISEKIFWTAKFTGAQFIIIFRELFTLILNADFGRHDAADLKINTLTNKVFFIFPFISIQKEFGYSDVTEANNTQVSVEQLFKGCTKNIKIMKDVSVFYKNLNIEKVPEQKKYDNVIIPTYIINLPERTDRLSHIEKQFSRRDEFDITIVDACKHIIGAVGLWQSVRKIISMAICNDDDVIIICEDDHEFTEAYSKEFLFKNIIEAHQQGAEILSGGIGGFGSSIPVAENRYWIESFLCTQFLVLYRSIFERILNEPFDETITADGILSDIAGNKMTLFPFISIQKEFGYSDVTAWNNGEGNVSKWFINAAKRLKLIQHIYKEYATVFTTK